MRFLHFLYFAKYAKLNWARLKPLGSPEGEEYSIKYFTDYCPKE